MVVCQKDHSVGASTQPRSWQLEYGPPDVGEYSMMVWTWRRRFSAVPVGLEDPDRAKRVTATDAISDGGRYSHDVGRGGRSTRPPCLLARAGYIPIEFPAPVVRSPDPVLLANPFDDRAVLQGFSIDGAELRAVPPSFWRDGSSRKR